MPPFGLSPHRRQRWFDLSVRKNLLRNYFVHCIEGGLFVGGMQFLNTSTVGPKMVQSLGAPVLIISLMPVLMSLGFTLPQLLMAHRIERWHLHKPAVALTGIFQRLPFIIAAVLLLACPGEPWLWVAVAASPLMSGLAGGFTATAWQELVARTVPPERRAGIWAVRNVISATIGLAAGAGIAAVLGAWPGQRGYGVLHLIVFGFLVASWLVFMFLREVPHPEAPAGKAVGLGESLRQMPSLLHERQFRWYVSANMCFAGIYVVLPFLGIHALGVSGQSEAFLGAFVTAQMLGGIAGNVGAGWLGDRFGGRLVMLLAQCGLLAACLWATFASSTREFLAIYFLFGAMTFCQAVGSMTLTMEVLPQARRSSFLAVLSMAGTLSMLAAAGISSSSRWALGKLLGDNAFAALAAISALALATSIFCLLHVREPRGKQGAHR